MLLGLWSLPNCLQKLALLGLCAGSLLLLLLGEHASAQHARRATVRRASSASQVTAVSDNVQEYPADCNLALHLLVACRQFARDPLTIALHYRLTSKHDCA